MLIAIPFLLVGFLIGVLVGFYIGWPDFDDPPENECSVCGASLTDDGFCSDTYCTEAEEGVWDTY